MLPSERAACTSCLGSWVPPLYPLLTLSMARSRRDEEQPLTLGQAVKARVQLIVWCKACRHRADDPDVLAELRRRR